MSVVPALRARRVVPAACAAILALAACGQATQAGSATREDLGDFVVREALLETDEYVDLANQLSEEGWLEDIAEALNASLNLPVDIGIRFAECGQSNAFYLPDEREIQMCLELFDGEREVFAAYFETEQEIEDAVAGSFHWTVFHEVGHALVDVLDIPVTGREEDTADSLATWWLIDGQGGEASTISAALSFYTDPSQAGEIDDSEYAGDHSFSQQRYYALACHVYGSDPEGYAYLLEEEWLTPERAEYCPAEFERLSASWYALLAPHLKE
ncbi:DUF4344 domain-containing metallopeptidase [Brevundimonas bacteroides]|uniref:DUF4344 domain-containing metallopeptidase n=1 Tax=Brevundimonas bacteroides TaxID=74311 RepID=UPI000691611C|nr:DUF4344 domain-containing metallopeptidase [Brevundimonas bacteroides]